MEVAPIDLPATPNQLSRDRAVQYAEVQPAIRRRRPPRQLAERPR
jgi:hypothetical protein